MEENAQKRNEIYNSYGQSNGSHLQKAINAGSEFNTEHGGGGLWAGVGDFFGNIWNDITGKNAQEREFAQQEYMQEKQWEYDSPAAQMARMKAAGINPHSAAGGIAGGNVSAQAPAVPTGSMDVAGGIGQVANAAGGLLDKGVGAFAALTKLNPEIENIESGTDLNKSMSFLNQTEADGLKIDNKYKDFKNIAELNWRSQQLKNMEKDWDMVDKQSKYLQKQLDIFDEQIEAEIDLTKKRALEAEKHAFELQQRGNLEKQEYDFHEKYAYSRFSNADSVAFNLFKKGYDSGDFTEFEEFNKKYGEWLKERSYNEEIGRQEAITEEQFNQAWNEALGKLSVDKEFAPYFASVDNVKEQFKALCEWLKPGSSGHLAGLIQTFIAAAVSAFSGQPLPNQRNLVEVPELKPKKPNSQSESSKLGSKSFRW